MARRRYLAPVATTEQSLDAKINEDVLRLAAMRIKLREAHERGTDPLSTFEPSPVQLPFIQSVLEARKWENFFVGANRCGKTSIGAYCGAHLARRGIERKTAAYSRLPDGTTVDVRDRATAGWVFGLDAHVLQEILQPRYFDNGFRKPGAPEPFIPDREVQEWRPSDQILRLTNGSMVTYKNCEAAASKATGAGLDWEHFDEPPPKPHYEEATFRIDVGRQLRTFMTATLLPPEGHVETISWVYSEILAPFLEGRKPDIGVFNASMYDNPHLDPEEIAKLEARYPPGSLARRIRINGEIIPGVTGAIAYGNFHRGIHCRRQPPISPYRPLCWCWDFNVNPLVTVIGQREPGMFRCHRELIVEDSGNIGEMVDLFKSAFPRHGQAVWIYGDASGGNRRVEGGARSSYDLILEALRGYPTPVVVKVPEANPLVTDRVNAVNMALKDAIGAHHVEIDPEGCPELILDFEQVLADPRGGIRKTYNWKDPYHKRTHLTDALGAWIVAEEPVRQTRNAQERVTVRQPGYGIVAAWQQSVRQPGYGRRSF